MINIASLKNPLLLKEKKIVNELLQCRNNYAKLQVERSRLQFDYSPANRQQYAEGPEKNRLMNAIIVSYYHHP